MFAATIPFIFSTGLLAIIYGLILFKIVLKKPAGNKKMADAALLFKNNFNTFLSKKYQKLAIAVALISVVILYILGWKLFITFIFGAVLTFLVDFIALNTLQRTGSRIVEAARSENLNSKKILIQSSSIITFITLGLALIMTSGIYFIFQDFGSLISLALGSSISTLFSLIMFSNYNNTVAQNTASQINRFIKKAAGASSDLFSGSIIVFSTAIFFGSDQFSDNKYIYLPMVLAGIGIVSYFLAGYLAKIWKNKIGGSLVQTVAISIILTGLLSYLYLKYFTFDIKIFYSLLSGIAVGLIYSLVNLYIITKAINLKLFSKIDFKIVIKIVVILIAASLFYLNFRLLGIYGIVIGSTGAMIIGGSILFLNIYGTVSNSAKLVSELSNIPPNLIKNIIELNSAESSANAFSSGFVKIASLLSGAALFVAAIQKTSIYSINFVSPKILVGILAGVLIPTIYSLLLTSKVSPNFKLVYLILIGLAAPIFIALTLGIGALGGFLIGIILYEFLLISFVHPQDNSDRTLIGFRDKIISILSSSSNLIDLIAIKITLIMAFLLSPFLIKDLAFLPKIIIGGSVLILILLYIFSPIIFKFMRKLCKKIQKPQFLP